MKLDKPPHPFARQRALIRAARGLTPGERCVLYALSSYMDDDGVAFPTAADLAADLEMHERSVVRCLSGLVGKGCVERISKGHGAGQGKAGKASVYRLVFGSISAFLTLTGESVSNGVNPDRPVICHRPTGDLSLTDRSHLGTISKQEETRASASDLGAAPRAPQNELQRLKMFAEKINAPNVYVAPSALSASDVEHMRVLGLCTPAALRAKGFV